MVTIVGEIERNKVYYDTGTGKYVVKDLDIDGCIYTFEGETSEDLVKQIGSTMKRYKRKIINKTVPTACAASISALIVGIIFWILSGFIFKVFATVIGMISVFIVILIISLIFELKTKQVKFTPYPLPEKEEPKKIPKRLLKAIAIIFTMIIAAIIGGSIIKKRKSK